MNINNRKEIITNLQERAKEVENLKETQRQKRPIVIEFSGSPKSGKTSCINSLELFLKRNGFRVAIIQERASVCPIPDKHSPMFNIWTACASISGMLAILEQETPPCDILIVDRGIFDALCWFDWLSRTIESEQLKIVEDFLLLDWIRTRIDIIFSFTITPKGSIEREYANLLTDKLGTIMNEKVLNEYLCSIKNTIKNKGKYFQQGSIIEIETTEKTQDDVGKEVTEKTLKTLQNLLMERIGYVQLTEELLSMIEQKRISLWSDSLNIGQMEFDLRDKVEANSELLQPLPIAVLTDKEHKRVFTVKKRPKAVSDDSPEKDKLLAYIGGHTRFEDCAGLNNNDFISICRNALRREIKEEIGVHIAVNNTDPYIIYTPDNDKSKKHLAICFLLEVDTESLKMRLDKEELITNKGKTPSGKFHYISDLIEDEKNNFEAWTVEIFQELFNADVEAIRSKEPLTLFNS